MKNLTIHIKSKYSMELAIDEAVDENFSELTSAYIWKRVKCVVDERVWWTISHHIWDKIITQVRRENHD